MKLYIENGEALPAAALLSNTATPPVGFTETTYLSVWDAQGFVLGRDYKAVRLSMKTIVNGRGGFAALSEAEKEIACKHKIGTDAERIAFAGIDAINAYGIAYNDNSIASRAIRSGAGMVEIANRLSAQKLAIMAQANDPLYMYKVFGIEGTAEGDPSGIIDYIMGTGSFVGAGLLQSGYTPEGLSLPDFCALLVDILAGDGIAEN